MRGVSLFLTALMGLALAGCMHQRQTYYIVDPATGQPVPVVQQYQQPQYAQQGYAPPAYQQPAPHAAASSRGLFSSSPAAAQETYAAQPRYQTYTPPPVYQAPQPQYAQPQYAQPQYAQPRYGTGGPYAPAPAPAQAYAYATPGQTAYTLDAGDKLRVVVFGQDGITNSYVVGADGHVNLPLVGSVPARGFTTSQLSQMIAERLKQGYVREPHVSVEVEAYRPFFILGEVTTPGQYPYVANMTAEKAVAIAGGFSPRASKGKVQLTRNIPGQQFKGDVPLNYPMRPGDTVVVKERWF